MITLLLTLTKEIVEIANQKGYETGDKIIISDDGTQEMGEILSADDRPAEPNDRKIEILRKAEEKDIEKVEKGRDAARELIVKAQKLTDEANLPMYVWDAAFSFDEKKVTFFFQAKERIDFRELVRSLAAEFKKKVHLQQIGPRDRSKLRGGFGVCGRKLCCSNFLRKFPSVTMEVARDQGLGYKSPEKISGQCGRLLCCLQYEVDNYRELSKEYPRMGDMVEFGDDKRKGKVLSVDVINGKMKVLVSDGGHEFVVTAMREELLGKWKLKKSAEKKEPEKKTK